MERWVFMRVATGYEDGTLELEAPGRIVSVTWRWRDVRWQELVNVGDPVSVLVGDDGAVRAIDVGGAQLWPYPQ